MKVPYNHPFKEQAGTCPVLSNGVRKWRSLGRERRNSSNKQEEEQEEGH